MGKSAILFVPHQSAKCTLFLVTTERDREETKPELLLSPRLHISSLTSKTCYRSVNIHKTMRRGQGPCSEEAGGGASTTAGHPFLLVNVNYTCRTNTPQELKKKNVYVMVYDITV